MGVARGSDAAAILLAMGTARREAFGVQRTSIDGIMLEYEDERRGDPVIFIHGSLIADTFRSVVTERQLADQHRLITYRRRGYGESSGADAEVTVERQAEDCIALLRHLGLASAHVVGHSFGGCVALQMAHDAPSVVRSLTLIEPALMVGAMAESYRDSLTTGVRRYRDTRPEVLVEQFLQARWPEYRGVLDARWPGVFDQAVADIAAVFECDLPGLLAWQFGEGDARRIVHPTLSVLGEKSNVLWPRFGEVQRLLLDWVPNAEGYVCPTSTHFIPMENSRAMANALAAFLRRQPGT